MIHTNRIVTVGEQESIIDRPIVLYRGDREVEIEFTLVGNEFMFSKEGNVIKSVNASHGQLVLNTPSGEHMFSELAECHEGKVVFVVTKEMIDEFIEMGFYSFQIRLYDSAEMKSRVTIPPVMNGFDIRNPIAAEDETNAVDQGIVDYARIFKDQSNEELPTFDSKDNYNKTEWAHHDVITENKLNKIEDALYSINANVKESDVFMLNTLDRVKKDADTYIKEHIAEVEANAAEFERNLNTDVQKFKIDTNAAVTTYKNEVNEVSEELESVNTQLAHNENEILFLKEQVINVKNFGAKGDGITDDTEAIQTALNYCIKGMKDINILYIPKGVYKITNELIITSNTLTSAEFGNIKIIGSGNGSSIIECYMAEDGLSCFNIDTSMKVAISDLALSNKNPSVKTDGIKILNASMMINLTNISCHYFERGYNFHICVGIMLNCLAVNCKCGYYTNGQGTGLSMISCYSSYCKVDPKTEDYHGCGYYIKSNYTNLISCASDSTDVGYKILGGNSIKLSSCGTEFSSVGIVIDDRTPNNGSSNIIIDSPSFHDVLTRTAIHIVNSLNTTITNACLDIGQFGIQIDENVSHNTVNISNCNFRLANITYKPKKAIPLDGYGSNQFKYSYDGLILKGKMIYRGNNLSLKLTPPINGAYIICFVRVKSLNTYGYNDTLIDDKICFGTANSSGTIVKYTNKITTNVTLNDTPVENSRIFEIVIGGTQNTSNVFEYEVEYITNTLADDQGVIVQII